MPAAICFCQYRSLRGWAQGCAGRCPPAGTACAIGRRLGELHRYQRLRRVARLDQRVTRPRDNCFLCPHARPGTRHDAARGHRGCSGRDQLSRTGHRWRTRLANARRPRRGARRSAHLTIKNDILAVTRRPPAWSQSVRDGGVRVRDDDQCGVNGWQRSAFKDNIEHCTVHRGHPAIICLGLRHHVFHPTQSSNRPAAAVHRRPRLASVSKSQAEATRGLDCCVSSAKMIMPSVIAV